MHEMQIDTIVHRLEYLERENRRGKILTSMAVALLGFLLLLGARRGSNIQVAEEIRARSFVLVNQAGITLARLGQLPHGSLGLGFYDAGTKGRLLLSVDPEGSSSVKLFGKDGRGSAVFMVAKDGASSLRILDAQWRLRASLATWPDGSPFLQLVDGNGKDRVLLTYSELSVTPAGKIVQRPDTGLVFFDDKGMIRWRTP